jgi:hypothetical protein
LTQVVIEDLVPEFVSQWPIIELVETSFSANTWPIVEVSEIVSIGASANNVAAVESLIGTATANFDTLGEVEQQVNAINLNLSEAESQINAFNNPADYTLFFENALV